jgi:hypothetical protein
MPKYYEVECSECGGDGTDECPGCRGAGKVELTEAEYWAFCEGTGELGYIEFDMTGAREART